MGNRDCFAYGLISCRILTERICDNRKCSFYKSHRQHQLDMEKYPPIDYKHFKETGEIIVIKSRKRG